MPKLVLIFLLFLVSAVGLPPQSSAQTTDQNVRIDEIAVTGTRRVAVGTVLSYLPVRVGDRVSRSSLSIALERLFETELFADIDIDIDGSVLRVSVDENPIITRANIEGNDALDEKLLEVIDIQPRRVYTRSLRLRPASACWKSIRRPEDMRRSSTRRSSNLTRTGSISPSWSMKDR